MPDPDDLADVLDNPEWTAEDFARAKPFAEVFPDLARRMREVQEASTVRLPPPKPSRPRRRRKPR